MSEQMPEYRNINVTKGVRIYLGAYEDVFDVLFLH